jgi:tetratricopeptide (TPR) repeat protein
MKRPRSHNPPSGVWALLDFTGTRGVGLASWSVGLILALRAGQGREVAVLHNNLGFMLALFEGPAPSLEVLRAGIAFAKARGLGEMVHAITASTLEPLVDRGELDEALEVAARLAERLEKEDVTDLVVVRAAQARILAWRGQAEQVAGSLEWLESTARGTDDLHLVAFGLGSSALARVGIGQDDRAAALLAEIDALPEAQDLYYVDCLPTIVRMALALGDRDLAERLVDRVEPSYPYAGHALLAANAALAEARGDLRPATDAYAEAADRWERFGDVPENAFALLGQGRCLVGLARPTEGRTGPARSSRDFRAARCGTGARGDGRAPPAGDRAQFLETACRSLIQLRRSSSCTRRVHAGSIVSARRLTGDLTAEPMGAGERTRNPLSP